MLILLMWTTMCCPLFLQGQTDDWQQTVGRHEFSFAVGDPFMSNYSRVFTFNNNNDNEYISSPSWLVIPTSTDVYTTMSFTVGYRYRFLKWFWFGFDISYCGFFGTSRDVYLDEPVYHYRENMLCILPSMRFSYFHRKHVMLYSGLALGLKLNYAEAYNAGSLNYKIPFQVTLLGVSAGNQNWFGFAEVGAGNEGFAKVGFGYRFNAERKQNILQNIR